MAAMTERSFNLTGVGETRNGSMGGRVSANLFELLGVPALLGAHSCRMTIGPARTLFLLSYSLWQRRFRLRTQASLARPLTLNGESYNGCGCNAAVWCKLPGYAKRE